MTMKKKVHYVDPPEGWRYGFPKPYDRKANPDFYAWLVKEGYPQSMIDRYKSIGLPCGNFVREEEVPDDLLGE
jgi:hypothetical protein